MSFRKIKDDCELPIEHSTIEYLPITMRFTLTANRQSSIGNQKCLSLAERLYVRRFLVRRVYVALAPG